PATVLPRPPLFPRLLPKIQCPHPAPLPPQSRTYGHLKAARNLQCEMDDLSNEERRWCNILIKHRGFASLVPIGRNLTQQEKNDEDDKTDSAPSNGPPSVGEDVEDEDESDEDDEEATDEVEESSEV
ncbi:hypothetical protein GGX14DRAFT_467731, partial [Mycena pura]